MRSIWIGFDAREAAAFEVARRSIRRFNAYLPVHGLVLDDLRERGLYRRPTERRDGKLWDVISKAPMATEFAISRFLVPTLAAMGDLIEVQSVGEEHPRFVRGITSRPAGWALFLDADMLVRCNLFELFSIAERHENRDKAVLCVQHDHRPQTATKMDGQTQTVYPRKNWSSVMLFNCDHPSNRALDVEMVNTLPGRDLHRFCWLKDSEIGALGPEWNFLVGHSDPKIEPKIVHFTDGCPFMPGYENVPFADEWRAEMHRWAA